MTPNAPKERKTRSDKGGTHNVSRPRTDSRLELRLPSALRQSLEEWATRDRIRLAELCRRELQKAEFESRCF